MRLECPAVRERKRAAGIDGLDGAFFAGCDDTDRSSHSEIHRDQRVGSGCETERRCRARKFDRDSATVDRDDASNS